MLGEKKIIIVTPAGRKRYLEILLKHVERLKGIVDEYHLWVNTCDQNDIEYMRSLKSDFVKVIEIEGAIGGNHHIHKFFHYCTEENTVYVRFDDDVVFLDSRESFINFVRFRIQHPEYFVVYGNIINNAIISHLHQKMGHIGTEKGHVNYDCLCNTGLCIGEFCEYLHNQFLSKPIKDFYFDKWVMTQYERVSINCISWLGEEFKKFNGNVGNDEELWLSVDKPRELQRPNCVYGGFICCHFAFHSQRDHMDRTGILKKYSYKALPSFKDMFYYREIEQEHDLIVFKDVTTFYDYNKYSTLKFETSSGLIKTPEDVILFRI